MPQSQLEDLNVVTAKASGTQAKRRINGFGGIVIGIGT